MPAERLAFCVSEDRRDCETGLRLAVLSLSAHCPGSPVFVYRHAPSPEFQNWIAAIDHVTLIDERPVGASAWNCKPHALLPLLERGFESVVWLDSDIIVTRDCRSLFTSLPADTLAVTQEPASQPLQGSQVRTAGWGLESGRNLPVTLNTSVLRVTPRHVPLLKQWMAMLGEPEYVQAQQRPLGERPVHFLSDQDVLNALLGARGWEHIPIRMLRSGVDIIHAGGALGYSLSERLRGVLRPLPTFLHATAGKPWHLLSDDPLWRHPGFFGWYRRLLQELSPYVAESRRYRRHLGEETPWMDRATPTGIALRSIGLGHHALRGLPLTAAATVYDLAGGGRR